MQNMQGSGEPERFITLVLWIKVLKYKISQNVLNAVNNDSKTITSAIWSEFRLFNIISDNVKEHEYLFFIK